MKTSDKLFFVLSVWFIIVGIMLSVIWNHL
jgi:preprotein translocase subunit SecG